ncbi:MAG: CYTH domain-containing protein [Patescibacteria group bacterium]
MKKEQYEIEIKSLLGTEENADKLRSSLKELDSTCALIATSTQLNHYFEGGDPRALLGDVGPLLTEEAQGKMERIAERGENVSVRTRGVDGGARIVMKASLGDDSSANGVIRIEVDEEVSGLSLEELDARVLMAGYQYQAKWSRSREEYQVGETVVCLDKNAGYGYVAEFERVIEDPADTERVRDDLLSLMGRAGIEELSQDRLERMFAHYNAHWQDYYGTDKVFNVE